MVDVITDILTDLSRNDVVALFTQSSPIPHATDITLCAYMYALMNNNYMKPQELVSNVGRVLLYAFGGLSVCLPILLGSFGPGADIYANLDHYVHLFLITSFVKMVLDAALTGNMKKYANQVGTIAYIIVVANVCVTATNTAAKHFTTTATGAWNIAGVNVPSLPISFGPWILGFVTVIAPRILEEGISAVVQKAKNAEWDHDYMLAAVGPVLVMLLNSQNANEQAVRLTVVAFRLSMLSARVDYNEVINYSKSVHASFVRKTVKAAKGRLSL